MYALCRSDYESDFIFYLSYKTQEDAERFVHNMRVELSRLKDLARQRGRVVVPFKMQVVDYLAGEWTIKETIDEEEVISKKYMRVTLRKSRGKNTQLVEEVSEIMDAITAGEKVNV